MNKKILFHKLAKLNLDQINKLGFEKEEIEYIKTKLLNDKIGLQLNFQEQDEKLLKNYMVLEEDKNLGINVKTDQPNNLLIEGENYYALKALISANVKVDIIYIDPPYNTGKEFVYTDNFGTSKIVGQDDPHRHSKWLSFMKRRLTLAKELLSDEGVIFVSIDDNEQAYLKVLMDEIFGEESVSSLIWKKFDKRDIITTKATKDFSRNHEYVLFYKKNNKILFNKLSVYKDFKSEGSNPDNDPLGNWMTSSLKKAKGGFLYSFTNSKGINFDGNWQISKENMIKLDLSNKLWYGKDGKNPPREKIYINQPISQFEKTIIENSGSLSTGTKQLNKLGIYLDNFTPKPIDLIYKLLSLYPNKNCNILDFFSGSGTTAQAVMELNKEDDGNRKFILVTNNENNIARSITRERIFRVIEGVGSKGEEISWKYSTDLKSLKNNSVAYLKVKPIDKINGQFEQIDMTKNLFKREFDKEINIIDLNKQEE